MNNKEKENSLSLQHVKTMTRNNGKQDATIEVLLNTLTGEMHLLNCLLLLSVPSVSADVQSSLGILVMEERLQLELSETANRITSIYDRLRALSYISADCWMISQTELAVQPADARGEVEYNTRFRIDD